MYKICFVISICFTKFFVKIKLSFCAIVQFLYLSFCTTGKSCAIGTKKRLKFRKQWSTIILRKRFRNKKTEKAGHVYGIHERHCKTVQRISCKCQQSSEWLSGYQRRNPAAYFKNCIRNGISSKFFSKSIKNQTKLQSWRTLCRRSHEWSYSWLLQSCTRKF